MRKGYLPWVLTYGVMAILHLLWTTSTGVAFILAGVPFGFIGAYKTLAYREIHTLYATKRTIAFTTSALIIIAGWWLSDLVFGALNFMSDNGSTNTVAYGLILSSGLIPPTFPHWFTIPHYNDFVWEGIRIGGWLLGVFVLLWGAVKFYISRSFPPNTRKSKRGLSIFYRSAEQYFRSR